MNVTEDFPQHLSYWRETLAFRSYGFTKPNFLDIEVIMKDPILSVSQLDRKNGREHTLQSQGKHCRLVAALKMNSDDSTN